VKWFTKTVFQPTRIDVLFGKTSNQTHVGKDTTQIQNVKHVAQSSVRKGRSTIMDDCYCTIVRIVIAIAFHGYDGNNRAMFHLESRRTYWRNSGELIVSKNS
jgi:hypothetical protein